jgi:hypothetical protein
MEKMLPFTPMKPMGPMKTAERWWGIQPKFAMYSMRTNGGRSISRSLSARTCHLALCADLAVCTLWCDHRHDLAGAKPATANAFAISSTMIAHAQHDIRVSAEISQDLLLYQF